MLYEYQEKVVVNIYGSEYTIVGERSEDYIKYIAEKWMIGSKNNKYSTTMIGVLTAKHG